MESMALKPPQIIANRYKVINTTSGGMGIVYFCLDQEQNNLPVAIKTFKPEFLSDRISRDRFLREAAIWVNLGFHVNIVQAYSVLHIAEDQSVYIILQMIPTIQGNKNPSLRSWLIPGQPMPLEQSMNFCLGCVRGMKYATEKIPGLVHRDLKPENILIASDYTAKITDFGLARINFDTVDNLKSIIPGSRNIKSVAGMGTPIYMSPEQWLTPKVDCRSDIYALGCVFYEMLTGEIAIGYDSLTNIFHSHMNGVPYSNVINSGLSDPVIDVVKKCVNPNPNNRFSGWKDLESEISALYELLLNHSAPHEQIVTDVSLQKKLQEAESYLALGSSYVNLADFTSAIECYKRASEIAEEQRFRHINALSKADQGVACANMGFFPDAIMHYEESIQIFKQLGDLYQMALHTGNLGNAYIGIFDLPKARQHLEATVNLFQELHYPLDVSVWLGNLGSFYGLQKEYKKALSCLEDALSINRTTKDRSGEIKILVNIGVTYNELGDIQAAIKYIVNAIKLANQIGDRQAEGHCYLAISGPHTKLKNINEAVNDLEIAESIAREIGDQLMLAKSLSNCAMLILSMKPSDRAEKKLIEAIQISSLINARDVTARSKWTLGLYYEMTGWNAKAIENLRSAVIRFKELHMLEYDQAADHLLQLRKKLGLI